MVLKKGFKPILSGMLKLMLGNKIVSKPYGQHKFYYEQTQHLMFMLKNQICYEPAIQDKAKRHIHKSNLIFDIGGNIGQYALFFSKLVGDDGKVISIEPDFKNFAFLQFNININNLKNVSCLHCGIGATYGSIEFFRDTETGVRMGSFDKVFVRENFKGFTEVVETKTIDSLIMDYGIPDFVKIDVEGFEYQVVSGLTKALNNTIFLIEVRKETKYEIFNYFAKRQYSCYYIDRKDDLLITDSIQIPEFANLIFKKDAPN